MNERETVLLQWLLVALIYSLLCSALVYALWLAPDAPLAAHGR